MCEREDDDANGNCTDEGDEYEDMKERESERERDVFTLRRKLNLT